MCIRDRHSLGEGGTMWGIYYSQGGMADVSGEPYGNGIYEFRADRNKNGLNNTFGKVFWKKNYKTGTSDGGFGYYTNFNRNSDGTYDDNPNDSTFPTLGYTKDGYLGTWAWIMLPQKIYLTGFTFCEAWYSNHNFKDFRIYGRRSEDSDLDTSTQANRVYLTEAADDWTLVYEHKEEFDGEPTYFPNPGDIITDSQNTNIASFNVADVCSGHRIDFRKGGVSAVSEKDVFDTYCLVVNKGYSSYIKFETWILHGQEYDNSTSEAYSLPITNIGDNRILVSIESNAYVFTNPQKYEILSNIELGIGTWILENVPAEHPIGIEQSGTNIEYYGDNAWYNGVSAETGSSAIAGINYYSGRVTIYVKGNFGTASFHCANHGYMGGQNMLQFSSNEHVNENNSVNPFTNNVSLAEKRCWPPRSNDASNDPELSPLSYGKIFENPIGNGDFNWEKRNAMTRSVYGTGYADGDYWMCSSPPGGTIGSCASAYRSKYTKWAGSGKYTSYYTTGYNSDGTLSSNYVTGSNYKTQGRTCICLLYTSPSPRDATLSRMAWCS